MALVTSLTLREVWELGKSGQSALQSLAMETHSRPVVMRIPAITLPPQLQQVIDEDEANFDMVVANPAEISKLSDEIVQRVEGLVHYSPEHCHIDAKLMDLFPSLKVISNCGVGVNHIDIAAASERGIAVGNTPGVVSDCTADMAFSLLMASARNVVEGDRIARSPETKQVRFTSVKTMQLLSYRKIDIESGCPTRQFTTTRNFELRW